MQWFKHMSNMRNDRKIKKLIGRYGLEGYGLYNIVVETIVECLTTNSPLPDLEEDSADLADFYNGDTVKINEMLCFMVNTGLFEVDEISGKILCTKVYKFLESSQTRSKEIRKMISNFKKHNATKCLAMSETARDKCEEEKRIEENRKEEKRKEYEGYCDRIYAIYPRHIGKKAGYEKIIATLKKGYSFDELFLATKNYVGYVKSDGEKYIKHCATFFGPKNHWRDHLVSRERKPHQRPPDYIYNDPINKSTLTKDQKILIEKVKQGQVLCPVNQRAYDNIPDEYKAKQKAV